MKKYYVQIEQIRTEEYMKLANRQFVETVVLVPELINELRKLLPRAPKMDGIDSYSIEQKKIFMIIKGLENDQEEKY